MELCGGPVLCVYAIIVLRLIGNRRNVKMGNDSYSLNYGFATYGVVVLMSNCEDMVRRGNLPLQPETKFNP